MTEKDKHIIDQVIPRLQEKIEEAYKSGNKYDFIDPAYDILDDAEKEMDNPSDLVEPLFRLIENSPNIDFGGPGPIGSFVERADWEKDQEAYEQKVMDSLKRKPTEYMIFMLFRICNDRKNPRIVNLVSFLKTFAEADFLDDYWKEAIKEDFKDF